MISARRSSHRIGLERSSLNSSLCKTSVSLWFIFLNEIINHGDTETQRHRENLLQISDTEIALT
jgi:hypothetical protein